MMRVCRDYLVGHVVEILNHNLLEMSEEKSGVPYAESAPAVYSSIFGMSIVSSLCGIVEWIPWGTQVWSVLVLLIYQAEQNRL
jgi:hypothetical protein